jgi:hypothetical protein
MMEISQLGDHKFFVLRRHGAQPKLNIIAIAGELSHVQNADTPLRVLFDWSQLKSWPFEAPSLASIQKWKETVPLISRAAIVHDQKWNRHAALLAALLRVGNAEVRSFRSSDYNGAIVWLEQSRSNVRLR